MKTWSRIVVAACATLIAAANLQAFTTQASQNPSAPAKAPESTPTVAGKWSIALDTPQGAMEVFATMKLDGKKITGSLTGPTGEDTPVTGEVAEGKVTFSISPEGNTFTFAGAFKDADHMAGSLTSPMGEIPWAATRVKG